MSTDIFYVWTAADVSKTTAANIVAARRLCNRWRHTAKTSLAPKPYRERVLRRVASGKWFDKTMRAVARLAQSGPG